jgi:hypothetical protein
MREELYFPIQVGESKRSEARSGHRGTAGGREKTTPITLKTLENQGFQDLFS